MQGDSLELWAFYLPQTAVGALVLMFYFGLPVLRRRRERGAPKWRDNPLLIGLTVALLASATTTAFIVSVVPVAVIVGLVSLVLVARLGYRNIPANRVGVVRRRYGSTHPEFRNVTPYKTRGVQARILLPGRSEWLFPALNEVRFAPRTYVAQDKIGLVTAKEGRNRPATRSLGRSVECDNFQDAQAFLLDGGEQGKQVDILPPGHWYYINPELFKVEAVPRVYVPPGTIGLVDAKAGMFRPPDRAFGPHVECGDFQEGSRFLAGGGQQGRQMAILQGGAYYNINPALFDVTTVETLRSKGRGELTLPHLEEISIPVGYTGVVITLDGAAPESPDQLGPRVPGHQGFRLPWVFLRNGGQRGVQEETLGEGTVSALNPYFVRVVLIPTRLLVLEWNDKSPAESRNYDAQLGKIAVTVQGHRLFVDMSQTLQIPPESAPRLVSKNGGSETSGLGGLDRDPLPVQRFVERVLGAIVVSYFNEIAAAATVKEFLEAYAETRTDLASQVRTALLAWGVEARNTTLGEFRAEDPSLNEALKRPAHEQMRGELLAAELANVEREDAIDAVRVRAESRRMSMELRTRIEVLGLNNVVVLEMLKETSKAPVPQFIGGGDLSAYLETQPVSRLKELLGRMRELHEESAVEGASPPSLPPDPREAFGNERP